MTILGPGAVLGDGTDGAAANLAHGLSIGSRSIKAMFSAVKYTLASMPMRDRSYSSSLTFYLNKDIKNPLNQINLHTINSFTSDNTLKKYS